MTLLDSHQPRYWGKYRGRVVNNIDELGLNRLLVAVPTLPALAESYAMPCAPYGGFQVGMVLTPQIGANVWVEFENGDPAYPVWTGCFWTEGEKPVLAELPTQQVFTTGSFTMMVNDVPGEAELLITLTPPGFEVPVTLSVNSEVCTLTVGEAVFSVNAEEASAVMESTNVVMTPEGLVVQAAGDVNITAPETTIEGNVSVTGAVEVEGNTDITGAVEIEGNVEIAGAVEIEGDSEILGAVEVEGDVEVLGAVEVEGDLSVIGAMEAGPEVAMFGACEIAGDLSVVGVADVIGDASVVGAIEVAGAVVSGVYTPGLGNIM
ncbi:MAG: hypothetical protein HN348_24140 [Proteobacteria bacterium]|nr:hypothetical protein [Pseudomonadota bacterium]